MKKSILLCLFTFIAIAGMANLNVAADTVNIHAVTPADTVGPLIRATVQFKHIALKQYESTVQINKTIEFPKNSELSITGSDRGGIREIYIRVDNATELPYKDPIRLTARGRHTARIRAVDNAGNETVYTFDYRISE